MESDKKELQKPAFFKVAFGFECQNRCKIHTPTTAKSSKMLTEKEWQERVDLIKSWGDKDDPSPIPSQYLFQRNNHHGYQKIVDYYVVINANGDNTLKKYGNQNSEDLLEQIDCNVAHQEITFPILYHAHNEGHLKPGKL